MTQERQVIDALARAFPSDFLSVLASFRYSSKEYALVMPLLAESLVVVKNKSGCTREKLAQICVSVLDKLEKMHSQGFAHCDIKPDNIMLDEHGQPYLIDFGLAH